MQIEFSIGYHKIMQIKGKQNQIPKKEYLTPIMKFIKDMKLFPKRMSQQDVLDLISQGLIISRGKLTTVYNEKKMHYIGNYVYTDRYPIRLPMVETKSFVHLNGDLYLGALYCHSIISIKNTSIRDAVIIYGKNVDIQKCDIENSLRLAAQNATINARCDKPITCFISKSLQLSPHTYTIGKKSVINKLKGEYNSNVIVEKGSKINEIDLSTFRKIILGDNVRLGKVQNNLIYKIKFGKNNYVGNKFLLSQYSPSLQKEIPEGFRTNCLYMDITNLPIINKNIVVNNLILAGEKELTKAECEQLKNIKVNKAIDAHFSNRKNLIRYNFAPESKFASLTSDIDIYDY